MNELFPSELKLWSGVKDATYYGAKCLANATVNIALYFSSTLTLITFWIGGGKDVFGLH